MYEPNYWPEPDEEEQYQARSDPVVQKAMETLRKHFENVRKAPIRTPYFIRQLQVLYEADYYPWIISNALVCLEEDKFLLSIPTSTIPGHLKLKHVQPMKFYCNAKCVKSPADLTKMQRKALRIAKVVDKYSDPQVTSHIGKHLEDLVWHELRAQQFNIISRNSNEYKGKKWTESEKNLDYIAEHKSGKLAIGVEIKNTLEVIPAEELDEKIRMCEHLGIIPVFPVRWIMPYLHKVSERGGFCWFFKTQMYPLGYEKLVKEIYDKLSVLNKVDSKNHTLEFPVITRTRLPEKSIEIFRNWVERKTST